MDRVRPAAFNDIDRIVRMIEALVRTVDGPQEADWAHTGAQVLRLIQSQHGAVFVSEGGFIAGEVVQTIISPDPVAVEHGWYARDRSGLRLLAAFERWADEHNCKLIKMSSGATGGAARILARRGYRCAELAWVK